MSIPGLPFPHTIAGAVGDDAAASIPVGGIKSGDLLLAVIQHDAVNGEIIGTDPSDWAVADGAIESATVDTAGYLLTVIWADGADAAS